MTSNNSLRITEIFYSLQGESSTVGLPTVFVRLTGCPLRCTYCDTEYAFTGGQSMALADIMKEVAFYNASYVTVTGGEPLTQPNCLLLMRELCNAGMHVSLETSGALSVEHVDSRVMKVVDIKTPGSGEVSRNLCANMDFLLPQDQVKFVICDREDYEWSKQIMEQYRLTECCEILFSPCHGSMSARRLAEWILKDKLRVRFQLQLHKYIWGEERGR